MNEGVEEYKVYNWRRSKTYADVDREESSGMVVGLQNRGTLPFGKDDEGVDELVHLAEVKEKAIVSKTVFPKASLHMTASLEKAHCRGKPCGFQLSHVVP